MIALLYYQDIASYFPEALWLPMAWLHTMFDSIKPAKPQQLTWWCYCVKLQKHSHKNTLKHTRQDRSAFFYVFMVKIKSRMFVNALNIKLLPAHYLYTKQSHSWFSSYLSGHVSCVCWSGNEIFATGRVKPGWENKM